MSTYNQIKYNHKHQTHRFNQNYKTSVHRNSAHHSYHLSEPPDAMGYRNRQTAGNGYQQQPSQQTNSTWYANQAVATGYEHSPVQFSHAQATVYGQMAPANHSGSGQHPPAQTASYDPTMAANGYQAHPPWQYQRMEQQQQMHTPQNASNIQNGFTDHQGYPNQPPPATQTNSYGGPIAYTNPQVQHPIQAAGHNQLMSANGYQQHSTQYSQTVGQQEMCTSYNSCVQNGISDNRGCSNQPPVHPSYTQATTSSGAPVVVTYPPAQHPTTQPAGYDLQVGASDYQQQPLHKSQTMNRQEIHTVYNSSNVQNCLQTPVDPPPTQLTNNAPQTVDNAPQQHPPQQFQNMKQQQSPLHVFIADPCQPPALMPANQFQAYLNFQYNLYRDELIEQENRHNCELSEKENEISELESSLKKVQEDLKHAEEELEWIRKNQIERYASAPIEESISIRIDGSSTVVSSPIPGVNLDRDMQKDRFSESLPFSFIAKSCEISPMEDDYVYEHPDHQEKHFEASPTITVKAGIQNFTHQEFVLSEVMSCSSTVHDEQDKVFGHAPEEVTEFDDSSVAEKPEDERAELQKPSQPEPLAVEIMKSSQFSNQLKAHCESIEVTDSVTQKEDRSVEIVKVSVDKLPVIKKSSEFLHVPLENVIVKDSSYDEEFPALGTYGNRKVVTKVTPFKPVQKLPTAVTSAPSRNDTASTSYNSLIRDNRKSKPGNSQTSSSQQPLLPRVDRVDPHGFHIPKKTARPRQASDVPQTWTLKSSSKSSVTTEAMDNLPKSSSGYPLKNEINFQSQNVKEQAHDVKKNELTKRKPSLAQDTERSKKLAKTTKKDAAQVKKDTTEKKKVKNNNNHEKESVHDSVNNLINLDETSTIKKAHESTEFKTNTPKADQAKTITSNDSFEDIIGSDTDPTEPLVPVKVAQLSPDNKNYKKKNRKQKRNKKNNLDTVPQSLVNQNYESSESGSPALTCSNSLTPTTGIDIEKLLLEKVLAYAEKMHPVRHSYLALRRVYRNIDQLQDVIMQFWRNHFAYGLSMEWNRLQITTHLSRAIAKYRARDTMQGRLMSTFFGILLLRKEDVLVEDMICLFTQNEECWSAKCQDKIELLYFNMIRESVEWNFENIDLAPARLEDFWIDSKVIEEKYRKSFAEHINSQFFLRYGVKTGREDPIPERKIERVVRQEYKFCASLSITWSPESTQEFLQTKLDNLKNVDEKTAETKLYIQFYEFLLCYPSSIIDFDTFLFSYCLDPTFDSSGCLKTEKDFFSLIFDLEL